MGTSTVEYVLGFAFDSYGRVALIEKAKPDWQRGRWNGIGGKIEADENMANAMSREFSEETGILLTDWSYAGVMSGKFGYVRVFTTKNPLVQMVKTTEVEVVQLFAPWELPRRTIENVPAMISLCQIEPPERPFFEFRY